LEIFVANDKFLRKMSLGALMASASFFAWGCLGGGGSLTNLPETELATITLNIRLGKVDAAAPVEGGVLTKTSVGSAEVPAETIVLQDMVLRFTSNLKDTVWDTVWANVESGLSGVETEADRSVMVNVELAPLRWWNIEVKTHDQHDSIIHYGNLGPFSSKGGQTVNMTVPLINSRFSMYEARYQLPPEIYPAGVPDSMRVYQKIFFTRLVLSVDGTVVRDTSSFNPNITAAGTRFITAGTALKNSAGHFFFKPNTLPLDTITHVQRYQYVRTGPRDFEISAYGYLEGDSIGMEPRLLFHGTSSVTITPGSSAPILPIVLDWKGPGSEPDDPEAPPPLPGEPDWSGVSMSVLIGKVGKIVQRIDIDGGIP
jgi:hypothetical protein